MLQLNILGNLGRDAEVKTINDKQYLSLSVASTEKQGENETTTWVSVLCSHNPNLLPFLKKGQQVFVSGRMKAGIYQSQNSFGIDISVFASTLQLCGGKREEQAPVPAGSSAGLSNGNTMTTAVPQPNTNGINTGQTVAPQQQDQRYYAKHDPNPYSAAPITDPLPPLDPQKDDLPF